MERIILPEQLEYEGIKITIEAVQAALSNPSTKVIIVEGRNQIFCLGMSFKALSPGTQVANERSADLFATLLRTLYFSKKPTLAVVQGKALAGGAGIAAACDVIIADENARFGFSESLFGLLPGMILPFLLQRMSVQHTKRLILSASTITSEQALEIGFVDEQVEASSMERHIREKVKHLSRICPEMVFKVKRMLADAAPTHWETLLERGRDLLVEALKDPKVMASVRNYAEYGIAPWEETHEEPLSE